MPETHHESTTGSSHENTNKRVSNPGIIGFSEVIQWTGIIALHTWLLTSDFLTPVFEIMGGRTITAAIYLTLMLAGGISTVVLLSEIE
jgi:hypothetical protein